MVASGAGIPMHFLAEPEGATRTTAEAAGGPTYRHFEQRQRFFLWMLEDALAAAVNRRSMVDHHVSRRAAIRLHGADISARDNISLAMAAGNISPTLYTLRDRGLIDDTELLRLVYRFCGESVNVEEMLARARKDAGNGAATASPCAPASPAPSRPQKQPVKVDSETGEERGGSNV